MRTLGEHNEEAMAMFNVHISDHHDDDHDDHGHHDDHHDDHHEPKKIEGGH